MKILIFDLAAYKYIQKEFSFSLKDNQVPFLISFYKKSRVSMKDTPILFVFFLLGLIAATCMFKFSKKAAIVLLAISIVYLLYIDSRNWRKYLIGALLFTAISLSVYYASILLSKH